MSYDTQRPGFEGESWGSAPPRKTRPRKFTQTDEELLELFSTMPLHEVADVLGISRPAAGYHKKRLKGEKFNIVLDVLIADGGWLTVPGIAAASGLHERTVVRQIGRLAKERRVEKRKLDVGTWDRPHAVRVEWRAKL